MEPTAIAPIPESWIEKLFHKMLLEYGKKFTDQWGMVDTGEMIGHWSRELAGYTAAEIKAGVEGLSSRSWPPTLPEFKAMCRPPVDAVRAYYEAVAGVQARHIGEFGEWSHPAIYWAAMPMSAELREQGYSQVRQRWEASLAAQLAKGSWDEVPKPLLALVAPGKQVTPSAKAQQQIKQVIATVLNKPASHDHRGWARKLVAAEKAGEPVTAIQLAFAREALKQGEAQ